jgi:superfamily I DNA/RNA helicase
MVARIDESDLQQSLDSLLKDINPVKTFEENSVNVMSIHKSKGLQADVVFINGLVNGVLPNEQKGIDTVEAQRRLLFVGITRTLRSLFLISSVEWEGKYVNKVDKSQFKYSVHKKKYNARTSRFVDEML